MKKLSTIILTLVMVAAMLPAVPVAAETAIPIDEEHFPDAAFRDFVSSEYDFSDDEDEKDGILTQEEVDEATYMYLTSTYSDLQVLDSYLNVDNDGLTLSWDKVEGKGVKYQVTMECATVDDYKYLLEDGEEDYFRNDSSVSLSWNECDINPADVEGIYVWVYAINRYGDYCGFVNNTTYTIRDMEIIDKEVITTEPVRDLTGIEYLTNLSDAHINGNRIKSLDLSANKKLEYVDISDNGMEAVNLPCEPEKLLEIDDENDAGEVASAMDSQFFRGNRGLTISVNGDENMVDPTVKIDEHFPDEALAAAVREACDEDGDGYLSLSECLNTNYLEYIPSEQGVPEIELVNSNLNGNKLSVEFEAVENAFEYSVSLRLYNKGKCCDSVPLDGASAKFNVDLADEFPEFDNDSYDEISISCNVYDQEYNKLAQTEKYVMNLENGDVSFVKSPMKRISSLEGINILKNLEYLYLDNNDIKEADISSLSKLENVSFADNGLERLYLSGNPQEYDYILIHLGNENLKLYVNDQKLEEQSIEGPTYKADLTTFWPYKVYNGSYYSASTFFNFPAEHVTITGNTKHKNAGIYEAVVIADPGYYFDEGYYKISCMYEIKKASQKPVVSTAGKTVKYSSVKRKATSTTAVKVTGAKTTKSYYKVKGSGKLTINKKTGKITVKKGTKKGKYPIYVKVKCASGTNYFAKTSATKKIYVRVK